ncbi:MAG TPA: PAS domain S-box protein [Ignavibacteria bacterium]|jgi:PAS domain S-box-containing protein
MAVNKENTEEYTKYVIDKLDQLKPIFAKAAIGDFSDNIKLPDEDNEFAELYTGIQTMLEVIREQFSELHSSASHYSNILESTRDGIIVEENENVVYVNGAFARIFGYDNDEDLIGMHVSKLLSAEDAKRMSSYGKKRMRGEAVPNHYDFKGLHKSGHIIELEAAVATWFIPGKKGIVTVVRDVSERKMMVTSLHESKEQYRVLAETATDAIISIDNESRILYTNSAAETIFGYSRAEMLGNTLTMLMPEQMRNLHLSSLNNYIKTGKKKINWYAIEFKGRHKSGKEIPLEISFSEYIKNGSHSFTGIIRDISERKKKDEQIIQSLKEKEILLKEIHHRVKNNLQIIKSLLSIQLKFIKDKDAAAFITESMDRITSISLIHELLYKDRHLSKIEFNNYLRQITYHLFNVYGIDSERITIEVNANNIFLGIDAAVPCGLIINELLTNCLKYAFPGDRKGKIFIDINTYSDKGVTLRVFDNGIGISREFDINNPPSMGMQLVKTLATQLDGNIELESNNNGTKFILKFPVPKYNHRI